MLGRRRGKLGPRMTHARARRKIPISRPLGIRIASRARGRRVTRSRSRCVALRGYSTRHSLSVGTCRLAVIYFPVEARSPFHLFIADR